MATLAELDKQARDVAASIRDHAIIRYAEIASRATSDEWAAGMAWYANANVVACSVADALRSRGLTYADDRTGAAVVSAFSPQESWARNCLRAGIWAAGGDPRGLPMHMQAATRALGFARDGSDPVDALNGPKTNAFARNIDGDYDPVTIDKHMCAAADITAKELGWVYVYEHMEDAVRAVAREYHVAPAQMQAIIWVVWRGSAD